MKIAVVGYVDGEAVVLDLRMMDSTSAMIAVSHDDPNLFNVLNAVSISKGRGRTFQ
jgi:hypothetical protein